LSKLGGKEVDRLRDTIIEYYRDAETPS